MAQDLTARLTRALWNDVDVLRATLSHLAIERIAFPWRLTSSTPPEFIWERRALTGRIVARAVFNATTPGMSFAWTVCGSRIDAPTRSTAAIVRAQADESLASAWLLVDLPALSPWRLEGASWQRETAMGAIAARVRATGDPSIFSCYVILDEREDQFVGTAEQARGVTDRHLGYLGFRLGEAVSQCVGCGAGKEDPPCVSGHVFVEYTIP